MLSDLQEWVLGVIAKLKQSLVQFLLSSWLNPRLFLTLLIKVVAIPTLLLKMHILIYLLSLALPICLRSFLSALTFHIQDRCLLQVLRCCGFGTSRGLIDLLLIVSLGSHCGQGSLFVQLLRVRLIDLVLL